MRALSITEADTVAGGVAGGYGWAVVYQAGSGSGGNNSAGSSRNEGGGGVTNASDCKTDVHGAMATFGGIGTTVGSFGGPAGALAGLTVGLGVGLIVGINTSSGCKPKASRNNYN